MSVGKHALSTFSTAREPGPYPWGLMCRCSACSAAIVHVTVKISVESLDSGNGVVATGSMADLADLADLAGVI